ncbi:bifunctional 4-hydroxy-2-oxoglutarate aldolase/2-dehydro-3-deoxy-phosphogluconate aldolase [Microlunatus panaciterrae]|uniref:2-dehydro-3-deoxyphosphogluconate aldolase/(4S)-4-hydroxy-2-oxoglutarate aldolase n=1 Tax=Microlunatus panaciterrae TaxID=400768 RepID=A0ABS2RJ96_9ACTN|nr:bifunctional 4-hydroxy-2-oxoglutarate aldolase/2-dehydro-3-deoxy-phosphogluconate aldolase [Microlunatus panaciterrae]MBM7799075.1 2-dehydro-3-deoxyphosphogluconate aldolase/(4S)-4-hydroxy-2-oxoglutarate aldolase [Microlunatus panaciterrae]
MTDVARVPASATLTRTRVVAVLRARNADEYAPVVDALRAGGVLSIELTLSTPGAIEHLPALLRRFGDAVELGVGTVTDVDQAAAALDAGAQFLVTPITADAVTRLAVERGVAVFPGGLTPSELFAGWSAGATAVKVFPANTVGSGYVSALRGPFPEIEVIPSGGVSIANAAEWIRAGAMAVSLGGPLLGDAFAGGDLAALTARAAEVRRVVDEAAAA